MIRTIQDSGLARVTLAAPSRKNAVTLAMWQELAATFGQLANAEQIRCVLLTGDGEDFCAGADISEFAAHRMDAQATRAYDATMRAAFVAVRDCPHPVVALLAGHCLGAGLELALMADIRLAASDLRLGIPGTRLSQALGFLEVEALVRAVGAEAAADLLLTARLVAAEEALALRLVGRIVAPEDLLSTGQDIARRIAEGAPLVNLWHKKAIRRLADGRALTPADHDALYALCSTDDWHEGYLAFLEKRRPRFQGR